MVLQAMQQQRQVAEGGGTTGGGAAAAPSLAAQLELPAGGVPVMLTSPSSAGGLWLVLRRCWSAATAA